MVKTNRNSTKKAVVKAPRKKPGNYPEGAVHSPTVMNLSNQYTSPRRGTTELLQLYGQAPWLRAIVGKIARAVAGIGWDLYAKKGNNGRYIADHNFGYKTGTALENLMRKSIDLNELDEIKEHPLLDLLRRGTGNPRLNGFGVFQVTQEHLDLAGEAYWLLEKDNFGIPIGKWPIPPSWVKTLPTEKTPYYQINGPMGMSVSIPFTEIIPFVDPNPENPYGRGISTSNTLDDEIQIDEYACHDSETECLTQRGWIPWSQITENDLLGTVNPEKQCLEYQQASELHSYDYDGVMHHWNGARTDALVTPNHRMWVYIGYGRGNSKGVKRGKEWHFETSEEASKRNSRRAFDWLETGGGYSGEVKEVFIQAVEREQFGKPPKFGVNDPLTFDAEDFAPFLGYFISEGSFDHAAITISQTEGDESKNEIVENIGSSLKIFDEDWVSEKRDKNDLRRIRWYIHHKGLTTWLLGEVGNGARNKRLPRCVFSWSIAAQEKLLLALMEGDGLVYRIKTDFSSGSYGSTSETLIDDIQHLCMQVGWSARKEPLPSTVNGPYWRLHIRKRSTRIIDSVGFKTIKYTGKVWCATVPNGLLVTRRNGCPIVSGNSKHQKSFFLNRARPDVIISGQFISKQDSERLERKWLSDHQGFWKQYKPLFFSQKIDVKELTQTFESLQMVQVRKSERDTFIQCFGCPPEKFGIVNESKRSTIAAADYFWTADVIKPRLEAIRRVLQQVLVPMFDDRLILYYETPVVQDDEHRLDLMKVAPWSVKVNEWRKEMGLESLGNAGEALFMPLNMQLVPLTDENGNPLDNVAVQQQSLKGIALKGNTPEEVDVRGMSMDIASEVVHALKSVFEDVKVLPKRE